MFLTDSKEDAEKVRKWSTQSREAAPWYQHEEIGYNYRMSNIIAGVIRGQLPYLEDHIAQKKAVYERYREGFRGLPVRMNPIPEGTEPNYWLSCLLIDENAMCRQVRGDHEALYVTGIDAANGRTASGRRSGVPQSHTTSVSSGRGANPSAGTPHSNPSRHA